MDEDDIEDVKGFDPDELASNLLFGDDEEEDDEEFPDEDIEIPEDLESEAGI